MVILTCQNDNEITVTENSPLIVSPSVIIVMGVSGAGKTTIGKLLAAALGWQFKDADDFHSHANKTKMHAGIALTDEDRLPWLQSMADNIDKWCAAGDKTVLACSALKASYRGTLSAGKKEVALVYLRADFETIARRLAKRTDHFMNKDLLRSQFATLEEPDPAADEHNEALVIDGADAPAIIVETVRRSFGL
jgi:gluconokinase